MNSRIVETIIRVAYWIIMPLVYFIAALVIAIGIFGGFLFFITFICSNV
jgi:hypothetical protein